MKSIGTYKIPTYAITYLEYGDCSGIEDEDIANIDSWLADLPGSLTFDWNSDEDPSFTPFPEFGLACDTVECEIYTRNY